MSASSMEPGLVSSSKAFYLGPQHTNQAYEPGFLINPFTPDSRTTTHRKPVICMTCGGFLNLYCTVDHSSGEWICNLCGAANASLDPPNTPPSREDARLQRFPELQSKHVDFIEDVCFSVGISAPAWAGGANGGSDMIYLLAIDDTVCNVAADIKKFLERALAAVPQNHRVGIICYGKCLSLLRLCGGISESVAVDVLPGDGDATPAVDHFITQGVYLTPASAALTEVTRIAKTLYLLANEGSGQAGRRHGDKLSGPEPVASVEALVSTACALGNVSGNPAVRLIVVAGRSIPHVRASQEAAHGAIGEGLSDGTREARHVSAYSRLGREALFPPRSATCEGGGGCWIDLVRVGCRSIRTDTLEALCASSGGMVFRSFSLGDDHMLDSIVASLKLGPSHFPRGGTICTLELRTTPGLQISHIIGPVLSSEDSKEVPGLRLDLATIDIRHMHSSSVDGAQPNELIGLHARNCADTCYVNKTAYRKLYGHAQKNTLVCGLMRLDPNTTVSVQCVPGPDAQAQQRVGFQCVVRYAARNSLNGGNNDAGSADSYQEVIRVMNVQLSCTDERELYLQSLDAELWALLMARSVVADFHVAQMQHEIIRALQFRSANEVDTKSVDASPREAGIAAIEALVGDVLTQWCPLNNESQLCSIGSEAAERTVRALYHLWLGPLLGGPAMHVQDAFLLRSHFLSVHAKHALRLMCPLLEVAFKPSPEQLSLVQNSSNGKRTPTESVQPTNLIAMAAAVRAHPPPSAPPPPIVALQLSNELPGPPASSSGRIETVKINSESLPDPQINKQFSTTPDSLWLLPGSIVIIDMGYIIIVWNGGPLLKSIQCELRGASADEIPDKNFGSGKGRAASIEALHEASLKQIYNSCKQRAKHRRPVAEVSIVIGGSPGERLAFSALSPSHMDRVEVVQSTAKHLCNDPWAPYQSAMIERSPLTDQQSFAMFLMRISPAHGNEWCRMGYFLPVTEEDRKLKAVQPVPMMDRGIMLGPSMDIIDVL